MSRLATVFVGAALLFGCAGVRTYHLPLTAAEGEYLVPALISTSESMGLVSNRGVSGAVTYLEDGTALSWQRSADQKDFILTISLTDKVPPEAYEERWAQAKLRADDIWARAVGTRAQSLSAVPVVVGAVQVQQPMGAAPAMGQKPCTSGIVCGPGLFCRSRGDGVQLCMGNGVNGSWCAVGTDCGPGLFCRDRGDGLSMCMGQGGPGAPCAVGTDCGAGLFCRGDGAARRCDR